MDLEGFVLSTAVGTARQTSGEVASVIGGRPLLPADGRRVCLAAIGPSDEDDVRGSAAQAAPHAPLWGEMVRHEAGHAPASPAVCSQNAGRDAGDAPFGLWGTRYDVLKQASGWADVLAEQERFAPVRGEVSGWA